MSLPTLPDRQDDGWYVYTKEQIQAYGQACREQALEEAALICNEEKRATFSGSNITYVSGYNDGCEDCEAAIRRLK